MKKRLIKHGIAILGIAVLAFLEIACATGPERPSSLVNGARKFRSVGKS